MAHFENYSWRQTKAPPAWRHDDVWFFDDKTGWAINSNGKIVKTEDGGESWVEQLHLSGTWLRCIGFADDKIGWMGSVTPEDRLYRTLNGGAKWEKVPESDLPDKSPSKICGLSVVNNDVIFGSGTNDPRDDAAILKTINGGTSWTAIDMAEHATLLVDNLFISENEGWVVGGLDVVNDMTRPPRRDDVKPVVLHTTDGGESWENLTEDIFDQFPEGEWGWKIQRLNEQTMFVALENFSEGAILRTDDGGKNWVRLEVNDQQENVDLEGIGFVDENTGWVGGWGPRVDSRPSGVSSATFDGGVNWFDFQDVGQYLNRFRFIEDPVTVGYASGTTIYKFTDDPPVDGLEAAVLQDNAPTNFSSTSDIELDLFIPEKSELLEIRAFDQFGDKVATIRRDENPKPGQHKFAWDFTNEQGTVLDAGPYVVRVTVDSDSYSFLACKIQVFE